MKIRIAKSLLEPVGIPWSLISNDEEAMAESIIAALNEHFRWMRGNGWLPSKRNASYNDPAVKMILAALEKLAGQLGAVNIQTGGMELTVRDGGYYFWIEFRIPHSLDSYSHFESFIAEYKP